MKTYIKIICIIDLTINISTNIINYYYFFKNIYNQNKIENYNLYQEHKILHNNIYEDIENKYYLVKNTKIKFDNCYIGILLFKSNNYSKKIFKYNIKKFKKKIKKIKKNKVHLVNPKLSNNEINLILFDRIILLPIDTNFNKNQNYYVYIYNINDIFIYGIYIKSFYDYFLGAIYIFIYGLIYYPFLIYSIYKYYIIL